MTKDTSKTEIRQLLKEGYFDNLKVADRVKQILVKEFPRTMFTLRYEWSESNKTEITEEKILDIINKTQYHETTNL